MKNNVDESLSRGLLVFLTTLYELRHLGQTAQRLSISVPKASRLLAEAREIFGDPLYQRFGHGLKPTERAREITFQAERVLSEMGRLFAEEKFEPASMNRVIRIVCLDNAIPIMIERALGRFTQLAPKAGLALVMHSEKTFLRLRAGEADFALFPAEHLPEDFHHVELLRTPYVRVVRAGHPLEKRLAECPAGRGLPASEIERFRRIQIRVHPDTDQVGDGMPGHTELPLKVSDTVIWTEYWLGAVRMLHATDAVLTLPWRTAVALSWDRPLVVVGSAAASLFLNPSIVWHKKTDFDVALEWTRSLFISEIRGDLGRLRTDEAAFGRLVRGEIVA